MLRSFLKPQKLTQARYLSTGKEILRKLKLDDESLGSSVGSEWIKSTGKTLVSISPVDGEVIGSVQLADKECYSRVVSKAQSAFEEWRLWPAPKRGEIVRQVGDALRANKEELGLLVSYEMGKSKTEGLGEVQEMIDICDFSVGLSRQLYGLSMHSERPGHRMYEQWHPLGVVGVITAFNFPVAVWAWNSMLAWVCGDTTVWKPSSETPLTAVACQKITAEVFARNKVPEGVSGLLVGDRHVVGDAMVQDHRVPLISATGSTGMGIKIAEGIAKRLGRTILELGGNNAIVITEHADIKQAVMIAVFGAVGTCGQRCTSTRRLIVHESVYDEVKSRLVNAYSSLRIGNPLDESNHVGPLINKKEVQTYLKALDEVVEQGGKFIIPGGVLEGSQYKSGCYVKPCIVEAKNEMKIVQTETFAPILYLIKYSGDVSNAIALQNGVPQGLSSSIITRDVVQAERFLSPAGSDCGIANVNIGTSGAEIGGAFGGEKETGGGREAGSDAWKVYMRRQTCTINYSDKLVLAQGVKFDL